jgi:hypothetical protein
VFPLVEIPALSSPCPEITSTLLNVPEMLFELRVFAPEAVSEIVEKFVTEGVVAEMVMLPAPTPTETIPAPEMLSRFENVPEELEVVFPKAVRDTEEVWTLAEIVIVEAACPIPIPAPADMDTLLVVALSVNVAPPPPPVAPEIVTVPAPTPTLTPPAPENTKALLNVPVELDVVFPLADIDTVEKFVASGADR